METSVHNAFVTSQNQNIEQKEQKKVVFVTNYQHTNSNLQHLAILKINHIFNHNISTSSTHKDKRQKDKKTNNGIECNIQTIIFCITEKVVIVQAEPRNDHKLKIYFATSMYLNNEYKQLQPENERMKEMKSNLIEQT